MIYEGVWVVLLILTGALTSLRTRVHRLHSPRLRSSPVSQAVFDLKPKITFATLGL